MQADTNGRFAGIGIEVVPENGFLKVVSRMDNTHLQGGIKAGDIILTAERQAGAEAPAGGHD